MSRAGGTTFSTRSIDAVTYATRILRDLGRVQPDENVLIVADTYTEQEVWTAFASAAAVLGARWTISLCGSWTDRMIESGKGTWQEKLTKPIWKAHEAADVVVLTTLTWYANPKPEFIMERFRSGKLRGIGGVCRSLRMLTGGGVDGLLNKQVREKMFAKQNKINDLLESGKEIRISDKRGTELVSSLEGISRVELLPDKKLGKEAVENVYLPDGEVMWKPPENATEGVVVTDGPISFVRESHGIYGNFPFEPLKLVIKRGRVVDVEGGADGERIKWIHNKIPGSDLIDEVAVGLNPLCRHTGELQEEKKKLGDAHIAFGGLFAAWHSDVNIRKPKVMIDDETIFEYGKIYI